MKAGRHERKRWRNAMTGLLLVFLCICMCPVAAFAENGEIQGTIQRTLKREPLPVCGRWKRVSKKYRFVPSDGKLQRGWLKEGNRTYYLDKGGFRVTGLVRLGRKYYFFRKNGVQRFGYIKIGKKTYFFDPADHGARSSTVIVVRGVPNTAPMSEPPEDLVTARNTALNLQFDESGAFYDNRGYQIQKATLRSFLTTALLPVGKTMYIWGGGWESGAEKKSHKGSIEATTIGVSPRWEQFFRKSPRSYNYKNFRYLSHLGLDCSGYVGWVLYNTFNSVSGHGDYVMLAQDMARTFAGWGWGNYSPAGSYSDFRPGDIMSLQGGHVYIVLGQCSDGSVVLVHSSPKGVMITGTASRRGKKNSRAVKLAARYMKKYFPRWYRKYPDSSRGTSYLTDYSRMRWTLGGKRSVLSDPDGLAGMNTGQVLRLLLGAA